MTKFEQFRTDFFALVAQSTHIVITAHRSPDDDSIASVLATYAILSGTYPEKDIRIIYTGIRVDRYEIFPHFDRIEWVDDIAEHTTDADLLIVLDVNNLARISQHPEILLSIPNRVCIDHHGSTPDAFALSCIEPSSTSNAELVYRTLLGKGRVLTAELAELFLLGILGDTGNLTHVPSTQSEVFILVKELVDISGIRIDSFLARFKTIPKHIMPLIQEFVKNSTYSEEQGWPVLQYSFISRTFIDSTYDDEDMSAASHIYLGQYIPRVEGQPWGFVLSPRTDGGVRLSARSLTGSVNVRLFCEAFGGGGHDRAAGANFASADGTPIVVEAVIAQVLDYMKNHSPVVS